jgi:hypothetical protein
MGSEPVRHPAADGNENRKAQRVARQHRLHAEGRHMKGGGYRGHRRIENRSGWGRGCLASTYFSVWTEADFEVSMVQLSLLETRCST